MLLEAQRHSKKNTYRSDNQLMDQKGQFTSGGFSVNFPKFEF